MLFGSKGRTKYWLQKKECIFTETTRLFELEEQHLGCEVRSILKAGKLPKGEIEDLKMQIKQLQSESEMIQFHYCDLRIHSD